MSEQQPGPVLRVVNPDATPEEVAAVVAVLSALGGGRHRLPVVRSGRPRTARYAAPCRTVRAHGAQVASLTDDVH